MQISKEAWADLWVFFFLLSTTLNAFGSSTVPVAQPPTQPCHSIKFLFPHLAHPNPLPLRLYMALINTHSGFNLTVTRSSHCRDRAEITHSQPPPHVPFILRAPSLP